MAYTHQDSPADALDPTALPPWPLPIGVTSRFVDTSPQSLVFHILESLPSNLPPSGPKPKLIVLVHGFPEASYSWRKMLPLISAQGYHAMAFDQRGYGRTFSRTPLEFSSFRPLNMVKDVVYLVKALGYDTVPLIVGHDFGAVVANLCALARPDMFKSLIMMSYPTKGAPKVPFATSPSYYQPTPPLPPPADIDKALSELPRPRKHYQGYYCSTAANSEMTYPTGESLHTFLRGYFHLKSADWDANQPHTLQGWTASELQKMPRYYIMDLADNMRQAVAREMAQEDPERVTKRASRWLPDHELAVYVDEWARITFQGGLNWYRMQTQPEIASDEAVYSGAKIEVPTMFVSGKSDWGPFQEPGALEAMEQERSVGKGLYRGTVLMEGAGHWANQEQPERCAAEILKMARALDG